MNAPHADPRPDFSQSSPSKAGNPKLNQGNPIESIHPSPTTTAIPLPPALHSLASLHHPLFFLRELFPTHSPLAPVPKIFRLAHTAQLVKVRFTDKLEPNNPRFCCLRDPSVTMHAIFQPQRYRVEIQSWSPNPLGPFNPLSRFPSSP